MITRDQAWDQLTQMLDNQNLINHCLAVEMAMKAYARHFNIPDDEHEKWAIAGLIHDADWEKYPEQHPRVIVQWLENQDCPADLVNAVASHGFDLGVDAETQMAKTLRAVDELTGLIVAVALVKGRKLAAVTLDSIKKKWKKKDFAKGVKREDIVRGAEEISIPLDEHIQIVLSAMQAESEILGL